MWGRRTADSDEPSWVTFHDATSGVTLTFSGEDEENDRWVNTDEERTATATWTVPSDKGSTDSTDFSFVFHANPGERAYLGEQQFPGLPFAVRVSHGAPINTVTLADATATEGSALAVMATINPAVSDNNGLEIPLQFTHVWSDNNDLPAALSNRSVTAAKDATSATYRLPTRDDRLVEPNETIKVALGRLGQSYTDGAGPATLTITDNDSATLSITATANGEVVNSGDRITNLGVDVIFTATLTPDGTATAVAPHRNTRALDLKAAVNNGAPIGTFLFKEARDTRDGVLVGDELMATATLTFNTSATNGRGGTLRVSAPDWATHNLNMPDFVIHGRDDTRVTALVASPGNGNLQLSWDWSFSAPDVNGWRIRYRERPSGEFREVVYANPFARSLRIPGLTNGQSYGVQVAPYIDGRALWVGTTGTPRVSTNANLVALTPTTATSAGGSYSVLPLNPTFSTAHRAYTASVGNATTHLKVSTRVEDTSARVKVGKTGDLSALRSGVTSAAIPLEVGANEILAVVTAQDGSTIKTYTLRITRAASANADLSALTAATAATAGGPYSSLTLAPAFASTTRTYTASVANAITHLQVTPTVADTGLATVKVGKATDLTAVNSGTASGAIALTVGVNEIKVEVTAEDGSTTQEYQVVVTRAPVVNNDASLSALTVRAGTVASGAFVDSSALTLTLTPSFASTTYAYTATAPSGFTHVSLTPTAGAGADATIKVGKGTNLARVASGTASGAVAFESSGETDVLAVVTAPANSPTRTYTITLTRASEPTTLSVSTLSPFNEGVNPPSGAVTATLNAPAPFGGTEITLTYTAGTVTEFSDYIPGTDTITILAGEESASRATVVFIDDEVVESDETILLDATSTNPALTAAQTTIVVQDTLDRNKAKIAFGTDAAATTSYTATVLESAGTVDVPVTVSVAPGVETVFTVDVVAAGTTATAGDYSISPATLTFVPTDGKNASKNLVVTITDDTVDDDDETIQLRIAPANDPVNDVGDYYARDAAGATALLTITDNDDPLPIVKFNPDSFSVNEGASATVTVTIESALTEETNVGILVFDSATDAVAADYSVTGLGGTSGNMLTISANATNATFTVAATADRTSEGAERLSFILDAIASAPYRVLDDEGKQLLVNIVDTSTTAAPGDLQVTAGRGTLDLSWNAPAGGLHATDRYDVQYKTDAAADQAAATANDPATGWVDAAHSGTGTTDSLTGLTNGTTYDVRVRAISDHDVAGAWADGSGTPRLSANAFLSALTATSAEAEAGPYSNLSLGTFNQNTLIYRANVSNATTHLKLRPTVEAAGLATVRVGVGSSLKVVTSGAESDALALTEGVNTITVAVTAEDGTVRSYTVSVTRAGTVNNDARLSLLRVTLTDTDNTIVPLASGGGSQRTKFSARVDEDVTSVKVWATPKVGAASVSIDGTIAGSKVISLDHGDNVVAIVVTASDGTTTATYSLTIERAYPLPTVSSVTPGAHSDGTPNITVATTNTYAATHDVVIQIKKTSAEWPASRGTSHQLPDDVATTSTASPFVFTGTGLEKGTAYTVRAHLKTKAATPAAIDDSSSSKAVTTWDVPGAPTAPLGSLSPIWSATLTVDADGSLRGCDRGVLDDCGVALSNDRFDLDGKGYRVRELSVDGGGNLSMRLSVLGNPSPALRLGSLRIGGSSGTTYPLTSGFRKIYFWSNGPSWSDDAEITVEILMPAVAPAITAGDRKLTIAWAAPGDTGGRGTSITGYDVEYKATSETNWTTVTHSGTSTSAEITSLTNGTTYDVQVRAKNGINPGSAWASGQSTPQVPPPELAAPTFSPANGDVVTDNATDITLTFDEAIKKDGSGTDFADADLSSILTLKTTDASGTAIPYAATINSDKTIITINPTSNLPDGAVYVAISTGYYDADGNQGSAANATFTVDATAPSPTFDPANGAAVKDTTTNITLTFDEAIVKSDGSDFSAAELKTILTLKRSHGNGMNIGYAASINDAKTVITLDPTANLSVGDVYVAISDEYYDAAGNRGSAGNATITVDTTAPVPTFSPVHEATVADNEIDITITFNEAIAKSDGSDFSAEDLKGILILKRTSAAGLDIEYTVSINAAKTIITIDPSAPLPDNKVYARISSAYYDSAGNQGAVAKSVFTVDTTATVPTFSPANGSKVKDNTTNITLTFDEAIKKSGVADFADSDLENILTLKVDDDNGATIPYAATINSAETVITINPTSNLARWGCVCGHLESILRRVGQSGAQRPTPPLPWTPELPRRPSNRRTALP